MSPQFYKGTSFVSPESRRELTRWGIEASSCGVEASRWSIQASKWGSEASRNIELSRRTTESSRCGIQASKWGTASSRWDSEASKNIDFSKRVSESSMWGTEASRNIELSRRGTESLTWDIESSMWDTKANRNIEFSRGTESSRWDIEFSRWGKGHPTSPTSQADASPSLHTSLPTQVGQQHLTPSRPASSAYVVVKQAPSCGLSVKPSRTSDSLNDYFGDHTQIRAVSENLKESNSSNIGHPRMNWTMDLKLITKGGTVPYQATGQMLFESEIHNQENSYFAAAGVGLELVSCESDLDLLPRVPDTVTRTTRSSLDQTSDKVGSAIDLRSVTTRSSVNLTSDTDGSTIDLLPDTARSTIDITSDTDGSTIDLTSDTDGSTIDLTSDTDGSKIDLTSDTDGSTIDLTSDTDGSAIDLTSDTDGYATACSPDTDGSTTDLTLSMRGSHLSVFSSQCKIAETLPNPNKDSNGRTQCRKRQEIIVTPLYGCQTSRGMMTPRRETRASPSGPLSDVELSENKHPQMIMEGVCQRKRKSVELENPQTKTLVKKMPLTSRARKYINGDRNTYLYAVNRLLNHHHHPSIPRIDPTRAAQSRRAVGRAVSWASPTMSSGETSDSGAVATGCPSVVKSICCGSPFFWARGSQSGHITLDTFR